MATQANQPERGRAKRSNPIAHVTYQSRDLSGVEVTGGSTKELVPVTADLRHALQASMSQAGNVIAAEAGANPDVPGVMVIKLRDVAIAKSHRPTELIAAAGMPPAGHGQIDEMLVAVNAVSLAQLNNVLGQRDTKKIRANISAVESFEAWDIQRRLPKQFRGRPLDQVLQELRVQSRRLVVQIFAHRTEATTRLVAERMTQLFDAVGVAYSKLEQRVGPTIYLVEMNDVLTLDALRRILQFQGVRQVRIEPHVWPAATVAPAAATLATPAPMFTAALPAAGLPTVSVFDTGVDPAVVPLAPWVASRDTYILPPDTDYAHGTSVSSLVVDSVGLNGHPSLFPAISCMIHDVCALETGSSYESDLILRLRDALAKRPDIKVWNLSLGGDEVGDDEFSIFGRELDALSDAYGVLFVVAAGNYIGMPRRGWPTAGAVLADRISSPGDSVRALTIGALTHLDSAMSLVRAGEPAPYSRRGPGPVFTPKPDIVHVGGNADANLASAGIGVHVLVPGWNLSCGCGTSFASPIVASMAAHAWQALSAPGRAYPLTVSPTMVKALMIHSAQLNSPDRPAVERRYFGAGLPSDPTSMLYDTDSSFTTLFELDIADNTKWRKAPFPIPASLMHEEKLRGEVIITVAYASPLNSSAGAEYVRVNVDVGFGTLTPDADGVLQFRGQVPAEGELGTTGFENAQVEHGGKWSPVKTYRRRFPKGKAGMIWALQASMVRRAFESPLAQPLRVVILITLRALDGNSQVYAEGQRALLTTNWLTQNLVQRIDLPVRT